MSRAARPAREKCRFLKRAESPKAAEPLQDTTIRDLDETTYRRLKARATLAGKTIGEMVNEAMRAYLNRPVSAEKRYGWEDLQPIEFPPGNERLSEEIDRVVYGA